MLRSSLLLIGALGAAGLAQAALPDGIAGPWYNPAQSGHGLSISLAEKNSRGVVLWHVYDPDGAPLTLYVDGHAFGRRIAGPAYAPRGMRFGEFDPETIDLPQWGTVVIEFFDCDRATLSWEALDPAFGIGRIPIERLARVDGLDCALPPPNAIPGGLYLGSVDSDAAGSNSGAALGVVDAEGRLWALDGQRVDGGIRLADIPGPTFISAFQPLGYIGQPVATREDGEVVVRLALIEPNWAWFGGSRWERSGLWTAEGAVEGRFEAVEGGRRGAIRWEPAPESLARLVVPLHDRLLTGSFPFSLRGQFFNQPGRLEIDAQGNACVRFGDECRLRGHVTAWEGELGLLAFSLRRVDDPRHRPYIGRGWMDESALGRRLVLVGDNGGNGFALVADATEATP